jgi:inorganic pyrophosphatase
VSLKVLNAGVQAPEVFNVVIEIPMHESGVKYEFDKDLGLLKVDRFLQAPIFYPYNYGYIPSTKGGDGDPIDAVVVSPYPVIPCVLIECRPAAVLFMEDEAGKDEKIIAVPNGHSTDISQEVKNRISYFFENYKKLDKGKWVTIDRWGDAEEAKSLIRASLAA